MGTEIKYSQTSENAMSQMNNLNIESNTSVSENKVNSVTSSANNFNFVNNLSATSDNNNSNDIFISQLGGNIEKTMASPDDINDLLNMITSENVNENYDTVTTLTNTANLENQLRDLLDQAGGAKKKASKKASKKSSKKSSKKASKKATGGKKKVSKKSSKKASKKASKKLLRKLLRKPPRKERK